jgi:outer membrane protein assembly factor BamB
MIECETVVGTASVAARHPTLPAAGYFSGERQNRSHARRRPWEIAMPRSLLVALSVATLTLAATAAAVAEELVTETVAQRHGLTRLWFAQVQMDRSRERVQAMVLGDGVLYVQSDHATVHALDAENGRALWSKNLGSPEHPSLPPAVGDDLLATANGSHVYVVNRYTGDMLYETTVDGAPDAGPALSRKRVFVPLVNQMLMAYRLDPLVDPLKDLGKINKKELTDEEKKQAEEERRQNIRIRQDYIPPFSCHADGRTSVAPVAMLQNSFEEYVSWVTDHGYMNVGRIDRRSESKLAIKYRIKTGAPIVCPPTYLPPNPKVQGDAGTIYLVSRDGFAYAIIEKTGEQLWKYSAAEPMIESPVVIGERVYITTEEGGLYCLDYKTGKQQWGTPEIVRFLAASKQRLYVCDKLNQLVVLDAKSGGRLDAFSIVDQPLRLTNQQTDRIYLANETGLVQCFREIEQRDPIRHGADRIQPVEEERKPTVRKPGKSADGEEPAVRPKSTPKSHPAPKATPKKDKAVPKAKASKKKDQDAADNPLVAQPGN